MNPQDQAAYEQNLRNSVMSAIQQPTAQLQETQAAAGAAGASAAKTTQDIQAQQRQLQQQQFTTQTQDIFDKNKQGSGYVAPQLYNAQKQRAAAIGINADDFDRLYEHSYTDPTSIDYNTSAGFGDRNAYGQIKRQVESAIQQFNSVPDDQKGPAHSLKQIGPLGQYLAPDAVAYENGRRGFAGELKQLSGISRVTQPELESWQGLLPSTHNSAETNAKNAQILDAQIRATFNTSQGLDQKYLPQAQGDPSSQGNSAGGGQPQAPKITGSPILDTIIAGAGNDVADAGKGAVNTIGDILGQTAQGKPLNAVIGNEAMQAGKGIVGEYGKLTGILQNGKLIDKNEALSHILNHPVDTALDVLGPLALLRGGFSGGARTGEEASAADGGVAESSGASSGPGKISQLVAPARAKNLIGNIRDTLIQTADKVEGNTVSGDMVAQNIRSWADNAKLANLPDADAIENAAQNAEKQYAGKTFKPSDLKNIYDNIENGYTKNSAPKSSTASYIDRGVQKVLSDNIEQVAPGFKKTSELFHQTYNAEKSPIRAGAKNLARYGIPLLGGGEAVRVLSHVLFGQ